jgi:hypothetical protein
MDSETLLKTNIDSSQVVPVHIHVNIRNEYRGIWTAINFRLQCILVPDLNFGNKWIDWGSPYFSVMQRQLWLITIPLFKSNRPNNDHNINLWIWIMFMKVIFVFQYVIENKIVCIENKKVRSLNSRYTRLLPDTLE